MLSAKIGTWTDLPPIRKCSILEVTDADTGLVSKQGTLEIGACLWGVGGSLYVDSYPHVALNAQGEMVSLPHGP